MTMRNARPAAARYLADQRDARGRTHPDGRHPPPRGGELPRQTGQPGRVGGHLRADWRIRPPPRDRSSVRCVSSPGQLLAMKRCCRSARTTCWPPSGRTAAFRLRDAGRPGAFVWSEPADRETMAAELQRTNPAEPLYAEDFAESSLIEAAAVRAVARCGNLKSTPRASSNRCSHPRSSASVENRPRGLVCAAGCLP